MIHELEISPITGSGVALYPPGATFGPRAMRDWEFVWIIQGDAVYQWGQETVEAPAGSAVLCRPGETDSFRWDPDKRTRHAFFHFHVRRLPDDWQDGWPLVRTVADADILISLFQHILSIGTVGDARHVEFAIANMLASFRSDHRTSSAIARESWPPLVDRALDYIYKRLEEDWASPVSLAEIADATHVTPEHLCRVFQSALGHTPAKTVRMVRLDRAATLLARSNYTVTEIAELCGFANPFHFSRAFRSAFGDSPTVVRARIAQGATPPLPLLLRNLR